MSNGLERIRKSIGDVATNRLENNKLKSNPRLNRICEKAVKKTSKTSKG